MSKVQSTNLLYNTEVRWLSHGNVLSKKIKKIFSQISLKTPRCHLAQLTGIFELKLQYWKQKAEQNKIASFSTLALFLEDCVIITFVDIKDTVMKHLTKR